MLLLLREALLLLRADHRRRRSILTAATACRVAAYPSSRQTASAGKAIRQTTLADYSATNVRRAVTVNLVRSSLLDRLPHPPDHTVFLFGGVNVSCFEKDDGPRTWYGNDTLRVYSLEEVHWDAGRLALDAAADSRIQKPADAATKRVYLDPCG